MGRVIEKHKVRMVIGKGGMGEDTRHACAKHGCVYVQTVGGAGALAAARVRNVAGVHFLEEFGSTEALWELDFDGLEGIVTIDSDGRSIHRRIRNSSRRILKTLSG
jgi:tartrate dehydratase beta subunit/fumarate hydratase class I family protein